MFRRSCQQDNTPNLGDPSTTASRPQTTPASVPLRSLPCASITSSASSSCLAVSAAGTTTADTTPAYTPQQLGLAQFSFPPPTLSYTSSDCFASAVSRDAVAVDALAGDVSSDNESFTATAPMSARVATASLPTPLSHGSNGPLLPCTAGDIAGSARRKPPLQPKSKGKCIQLRPLPKRLPHLSPPAGSPTARNSSSIALSLLGGSSTKDSHVPVVSRTASLPAGLRFPSETHDDTDSLPSSALSSPLLASTAAEAPDVSDGVYHNVTGRIHHTPSSSSSSLTSSLEEYIDSMRRGREPWLGGGSGESAEANAVPPVAPMPPAWRHVATHLSGLMRSNDSSSGGSAVLGTCFGKRTATSSSLTAGSETVYDPDDPGAVAAWAVGSSFTQEQQRARKHLGLPDFVAESRLVRAQVVVPGALATGRCLSLSILTESNSSDADPSRVAPVIQPTQPVLPIPPSPVPKTQHAARKTSCLSVRRRSPAEPSTPAPPSTPVVMFTSRPVRQQVMRAMEAQLWAWVEPAFIHFGLLPKGMRGTGKLKTSRRLQNVQLVLKSIVLTMSGNATPGPQTVRRQLAPRVAQRLWTMRHLRHNGLAAVLDVFTVAGMLQEQEGGGSADTSTTTTTTTTTTETTANRSSADDSFPSCEHTPLSLGLLSGYSGAFFVKRNSSPRADELLTPRRPAYHLTDADLEARGWLAVASPKKEPRSLPTSGNGVLEEMNGSDDGIGSRSTDASRSSNRLLRGTPIRPLSPEQLSQKGLRAGACPRPVSALKGSRSALAKRVPATHKAVKPEEKRAIRLMPLPPPPPPTTVRASVLLCARQYMPDASTLHHHLCEAWSSKYDQGLPLHPSTRRPGDVMTSGRAGGVAQVLCCDRVVLGNGVQGPMCVRPQIMSAGSHLADQEALADLLWQTNCALRYCHSVPMPSGPPHAAVAPGATGTALVLRPAEAPIRFFFHGNLKPKNILLHNTTKEAFLTDMGLDLFPDAAKDAAHRCLRVSASSATQLSPLVGTRREQVFVRLMQPAVHHFYAYGTPVPSPEHPHCSLDDTDPEGQEVRLLQHLAAPETLLHTITTTTVTTTTTMAMPSTQEDVWVCEEARSPASDMYAMGVMLYMVLMGHLPPLAPRPTAHLPSRSLQPPAMPDAEDLTLCTKDVTCDTHAMQRFRDAIQRELMQADYVNRPMEAALQDVVRGLLEPDASLRMTSEALAKHPFFYAHGRQQTHLHQAAAPGTNEDCDMRVSPAVAVANSQETLSNLDVAAAAAEGPSTPSPHAPLRSPYAQRSLVACLLSEGEGSKTDDEGGECFTKASPPSPCPLSPPTAAALSRTVATPPSVGLAASAFRRRASSSSSSSVRGTASRASSAGALSHPYNLRRSRGTGTLPASVPEPSLSLHHVTPVLQRLAQPRKTAEAGTSVPQRARPAHRLVFSSAQLPPPQPHGPAVRTYGRTAATSTPMLRTERVARPALQTRPTAPAAKGQRPHKPNTAGRRSASVGTSFPMSRQNKK